ncbi:MAG: cytochrome c family protein [Planctomycetota bacterium]
MPNTRIEFAAAAVVFALLSQAGAEPIRGDLKPLACDPAKVLGAESCARCHQAEVNQWRSTPHYQTFDTLHRTPEAKAIAQRLGLRSVKRNDTCVQCHYTRSEQRGRVRVVSGVSCESCHGPGKDWLELHADYGGSGVNKRTETAEHRTARREASIAAGMNNPANLYLIARQCLACHTTPNEELVNVGGHNAGSAGFELVAWSQGRVRHNFQRGAAGENAPSSLARVRVMYVVGALADLEASLRAVAKATSADTFGRAAATRAAVVKQRLWEVQRKIDSPVLRDALDAVSELTLTLGNADAINGAADQIGRVAFRFAEGVDGARLAAIDPLLPPPSTYKY